MYSILCICCDGAVVDVRECAARSGTAAQLQPAALCALHGRTRAQWQQLPAPRLATLLMLLVALCANGEID